MVIDFVIPVLKMGMIEIMKDKRTFCVNEADTECKDYPRSYWLRSSCDEFVKFGSIDSLREHSARKYELLCNVLAVTGIDLLGEGLHDAIMKELFGDVGFGMVQEFKE